MKERGSEMKLIIIKKKKKTLKTHHEHEFFEGDAGVLMPHRSDSRVVHFTESYLWPSLFSESAGYSPTKNARLLPHTKLS